MSKQLKAEIIAIGTELLLGQIANTNAQWLSEQLAANGIDTYYHTVVGDNLNRVTDVFSKAQSRSDIIIVSGGLGPTDDDMTREAFQQLSGLEMIEHKPSMNKIKQFFKDQGTRMTPNNRRQARVFREANIIKNDIGMAPGMNIKFENKRWFLLPGIPRELKKMARTQMFPTLKKLFDEDVMIKSIIMRFIGIGEAQLVYELQDVIRYQNNPTIAPLAQKDGLVLRLTAKDSSINKVNDRLDEMKERILAKVGDFVYGYDDEKIEEKIISIIKSKKLTIATAESLTGGKFAEKLISVEGASSVIPGSIVAYQNSIKENLLDVSPDTIERNGAVSRECALEMAKNICHKLDTNIGISFTGVAGPGKLEGHRAGTVFIAIYSKFSKSMVEKFTFPGDRYAVRSRTVLKGFELLYNYLKS